MFVGMLSAPAPAAAGDPWLEGVRRYRPGTFAGFGQDLLPLVVAGPPRGAGLLAGSTDVISLGHGGVIQVAFRDNLLVDGPGDDFVVYENPFHTGSLSGVVYEEVAWVEVSSDGRNFVRFPVDVDSGEGLAGLVPVTAGSDNGDPPLDPASGGDFFDLADVGVDVVRVIRIVDAGDEIVDLGNLLRPWGQKAGFDLDAIGSLHWIEPGTVSGVVTAGGEALAGVKVKLIPDSGERNWRRRTNASGVFRFRRVIPSGGFTVRARKGGHGRAQAAVFLGEQQRKAQVELALPSAGESLRR